MKLAHLFFLGCFLTSFTPIYGQNNEKQYDFSKVDLDQVDQTALENGLKAIRAYNDSINQLFKADSLYQLYQKVNLVATKDYNAWYLGGGPSLADLSALNRGLHNNQLEELNETAFGFTYVLSYAFQRNRFVHDFTSGFTLGSAAEKDGIKIGYNLFDLLAYKFGYAVVNEKRLSIAPFVGINPQFSSLNIENNNFPSPQDSISSFENLIGFVANNPGKNELYLNRFQFTGEVGIQADYHIKYSKRGDGVMLGLRAGQVIPAIDLAWRSEGTKFDELEDIQLRETYLFLVAKFYWRRNKKNEGYPYSIPPDMMVE